MSYDRVKTEHLVVPDDNMQILVVEDNLVVADYLKSILRRNFTPCTTTIVNGIAGAIACLQERQFDLILLDTTLKLKGEESAQAIREETMETPIILMAVSEVKITYEYVIGCGADGIIYKPIEVESLINEVQRIIDIDLSKRGTNSSFHRCIDLDK